MSFLHPAVLWALPAAAIPLVIHLLRRRKLPKKPQAQKAEVGFVAQGHSYESQERGQEHCLRPHGAGCEHPGETIVEYQWVGPESFLQVIHQD